MSFIFVCPKCGTRHSLEEYRESRFCRECEKFLTRKDWVKDTTIRHEERGSSNWGLFPYKPYQQQLEFMKDIKSSVGNRSVLVAEACNGFGKTACALASILQSDRRIV